MYRYIDDKEFISKMRSVCGEIMQDLCHILKEDYDIGVVFYLVGSGAKNLILQNEQNPVDLDYNLEIMRCEDYERCRDIKEAVRKAFNKALRNNDWSDCQDSRSSLTTEKRYFKSGNSTGFSMDVAITTRDNKDKYYRLIHKKTGIIVYDEYMWEEAHSSKKLKQKVDYIKRNGKWILVREQYCDIKNRYLRQNDHNHPSFICYLEAVNNVYSMKNNW